MRPYEYVRASSLDDAVAMAADDRPRVSAPDGGAMIYAGGTTMLDLMKHKVFQPDRVVDILRLEQPGLRAIRVDGDTLRLGALVTMHDAAENEDVRRLAPVLSESLWLAASQQLRYMATLGGNVLQRTRCPYYRDPSWKACNKREPGSGCAMVGGVNRLAAVLGTSNDCIAMYPGDWAQALVAFDATVKTMGPDGPRTFPFGDLHRLPGNTPHEETTLAPGEIITGYSVPLTAALRRSIYIKARDRESYAFANASAATGLEMDGDTVVDVRLGLGGVASVPWRATNAEDYLRGRVLTANTAAEAGRIAFEDARTFEHNAFKTALGPNVIVKALTALMAMED